MTRQNDARGFCEDRPTLERELGIGSSSNAKCHGNPARVRAPFPSGRQSERHRFTVRQALFLFGPLFRAIFSQIRRGCSDQSSNGTVRASRDARPSFETEQLPGARKDCKAFVMADGGRRFLLGIRWARARVPAGARPHFQNTKKHERT